MLLILSIFTDFIGISLRQKWVLMPFLFLFVILFLSKFKYNRL